LKNGNSRVLKCEELGLELDQRLYLKIVELEPKVLQIKKKGWNKD
jgi:hypothetical protein